MTPADIRKLADMDHDWLPRQYAEVLRACADVVEAADAHLRDCHNTASNDLIDAFTRLENLK